MLAISRLLSACLCLFAESVAVGWENCSARRLLRRSSKSSRFDLILFAAIVLGLGQLLAVIFTFGLPLLASAAHTYAADSLGWMPLRIKTGALPADIVIFTLAWTLADYWHHRLMHTRFGWPAHRLHHSATEFNVLTGHRHHPATDALGFFLTGSVVSFLAMPAWFVLIWFCYVSSWVSVTHMDVTWDFGFVGRWLVVSPAHHRLHHSRDESDNGYNFGNVLVIWDRIFGTYRAPGPNRIEIGCSDDYEAGLLSELVRDSRRLVSISR